MFLIVLQLLLSSQTGLTKQVSDDEIKGKIQRQGNWKNVWGNDLGKYLGGKQDLITSWFGIVKVLEKDKEESRMTLVC